jgi:RNA polymerase sigma-70 factor (ECF subfamily)
VRRAGHNPEDAKDLTQSFFAHLLERDAFQMAKRERGRFRTFLLASLKHHLVDVFRRGAAQKRGAGREFISLDGLDPETRYNCEPQDVQSPEVLYDRSWAETVLQQALKRLRQECAETKHGPGFDTIKDHIWGNRGGRSCAELGRELGISEEAAKKAVQRVRGRFRELLREEVAGTVSSPVELEDEIRHLLRML